MKYFSYLKQYQKPERKFLLNILSIILYDYMVKLIKASYRAWNLGEKIENNEVIKIKGDFLDKIMNTDNSSSKLKTLDLFRLQLHNIVFYWKSANRGYQRRKPGRFLTLKMTKKWWKKRKHKNKFSNWL